jgi:Uma2 family endonuclease
MALLERLSVKPTKELTSLAKLRPGTRYVPERLLTVDEFYELIDEDSPAELDGGAVVMPSPVSFQHEDGFSFLLGVLRSYVNALGLGVVVGSRMKVRLALRTAREPDISFISTARKHLIQAQEIAGPPDLIVEIVTSDTGRSEALAKVPQYETAGVTELWLLDFPRRRVHFLVLKGGAYQETVLGEGDTLTSKVVPGFRLAVSVLLSPAGQFPSEVTIVQQLLQAQADVFHR